MTHLRLVILSLLLPTAVFAQTASVWKHLSRPDGGLYLSFLTVTSNPNDTTGYEARGSSDVMMIGGIAGMNLPFVRLDENMSLGFNPNISAARWLTGFPAISFGIPLYATFKWGTDATWQGSTSPIGLTVGVGYNLQILITDVVEDVVTIANPSLLADINFGKRRGGVGVIKLRFQTDIVSYTQEYEGGKASYFQYLLGLVIATGY